VFQENVEHLEQMYIEFETMQREIVIWLDNAEDILRELDQLTADSEPSDDDVNKFKVTLTSSCLLTLNNILCDYTPIGGRRKYRSACDVCLCVRA